jgi:pyridoxine 5-phosphate synthase
VREDRRHIQDADLFRIRNAIKVNLNQELAPTDAMVDLALRVKPDEVCIVPERREELTTEGGLDAAAMGARLGAIIKRLRAAKIGVSLFVEPDQSQLQAAADLGADYVELHTGTYANLCEGQIVEQYRDSVSLRLDAAAEAELDRIREAVTMARSLKLKPNAGHGLNYRNVAPIVAIPGLQWLHIGHAIVARAVMVGMETAVREMKSLLAAAG